MISGGGNNATRAIIRKDGWVLCTCDECRTLNYCEPHGTTAMCSECRWETEHSNIPYDKRDGIHHDRVLVGRNGYRLLGEQ